MKPGHWEERVFRILVALYPRRFNQEYGAEMKLVLSDLLADPEIPRWRVWMSILGELGNLGGGSASLGVLFGLLVLLIWGVNRFDTFAFDPTLGLVLIAVLFVVAGFVGSSRSGTVAGGIWLGFVAGMVSSLTVPGDYWFFHLFPFYDPISFVFTMAISAAVVMLLAFAGAVLPGLSKHRSRVCRSAVAFVGAWREDSRLST